MKKGILIVLGFVAISIVLTWVWSEWVRDGYAQLFAAVAGPVYRALGFDSAPILARRLRYINFVPFLALVLVTPGIGLRRRAIGTVAGVFVIFFAHLALNLTALLQPGPALPVVSILISDAFPFFVWIVVAYPVLARYLPGTRRDAIADAGEAPDSTDP